MARKNTEGEHRPREKGFREEFLRNMAWVAIGVFTMAMPWSTGQGDPHEKPVIADVLLVDSGGCL